MTFLDCDFLMVGAGMAGVSAAAALSTHGRTIVVEQESQPGYHATGRSAAIFANSYGNDVVRQLSAESRRLLAPELLGPRGLLYLRFTSSKAEAFEALDALPRLSPQEVCALVPILREDAIVAARWEADAADIDVATMQSAYLRALRADRGLLLVDAPVRAARWRDGGWEVDAGDNRIRARIVVNAAGAWAGPLGRLFGAKDPGLVPMRRSAAIIDGPAEGDVAGWPMVVDIDESFYFKPEGGKVMLSPADVDPSEPGDAYADDLAIAEAVDRFESVTTLPIRRVRTPWAGLRTFAPDAAPLIGFDSQVEGMFWLAGQGGFGIQTAPAAAALSAALITGCDAGFDAVDAAALAKSTAPSRFD